MSVAGEQWVIGDQWSGEPKGTQVLVRVTLSESPDRELEKNCLQIFAAESDKED